MDQGFQAAVERARAALKVVPLDAPGLRATSFDVRFDGGAFELHVYEVRESPEMRPLGIIEHWQTVEVARFALSPIALARLLETSNTAASAYEAVIGRPLPTEQQLNSGVARIVDAQVRQNTQKEKKR
jgi:hypothetical protein